MIYVGLTLIPIAVISVYVLLRPLWRREVTADDSGLIQPTLGRFNPAFERVFPTSAKKRQNLRSELVQAGYYQAISVGNFLAVRNAAILAWLAFCAAFAAFEISDPTSLRFWGLTFGGALVLFGLPRVVLSSLADRRAHGIQNDLPDALDMITMMMSGGLTMERSLQNVIGEFQTTHPALSTELSIVARQTITGSFDQAMMSFAERLNLPDVTTLTALMRRSNKLGGRVVDALREYADSMRRLRHQRAEERGNKASVKLLMPVLFCLAPPIYILLLGPSVLELREFVTRENQPGGILSPSVESANRIALSSDEEPAR